VARPRLLNTEFSAAGGVGLQARVMITTKLLGLPEVVLRKLRSEQGGLVICVVSPDDALALMRS